MSKLTYISIDDDKQEAVGRSLKNVRTLLQIDHKNVSDLTFISYSTILYYERSNKKSKKNVNYLWMIYTDYFLNKIDAKEIDKNTADMVVNELKFIETCLYGNSTAFDWYNG